MGDGVAGWVTGLLGAGNGPIGGWGGWPGGAGWGA